jgi:transcriptional regulator GlxA family with amidase domain
MIVPSVGYASAGRLSRSFSLHLGMPPMAWVAAQQIGEAS